TLGQQRWYSGVWPNDTLNNGIALNAKYMNSYWNIPAVGGSGYSYNLTLFFDSSMLGKVTNATSMTINKRQTGVTGTWTALTPSIVNWGNKSVTISNLNSFSEFTITDTNATLQYGGPSTDLQLTSLTVNPLIATEDSIDVFFSELN